MDHHLSIRIESQQITSPRGYGWADIELSAAHGDRVIGDGLTLLASALQLIWCSRRSSQTL